LQTCSDNDQYEVVDNLPKWAYTKDEWSDLLTSVDKIINDTMYRYKSKPTKEDEIINKLIDSL